MNVVQQNAIRVCMLKRLRRGLLQSSHIDMVLRNYLTVWSGLSGQESSTIVRESWETMMILQTWKNCFNSFGQEKYHRLSINHGLLSGKENNEAV